MEVKTTDIKRNDDITLGIDSLSIEGQGIGRLDGYAVFVFGALPGELVRAHVIKATKSYAIAKLIEVITPSHERVVPKCRAFLSCGGCTLQHLDYKAQLEVKQTSVKDCMERIGKINDVDYSPIVGMDEPWGYRNKCAFPFATIGDHVAVGFFAPHSHRLVELESCAIQRPEIMPAVLCIRDWAQKCSIMPYDEKTAKGTLRHAVVRASSSGDVMAIIVTATPLTHEPELIAMLQKRVPSIKSIIHNVNSSPTNVIMGDAFRTVWGDDRLTEVLLGLQLKVSAPAFLQVNIPQTEKLYSIAIELAALTGKEHVLDAYCGIGSITLAISKHAKSVIGIESVPEAIKDANLNKRLNKIENASFTCALAEEELPRLIAAGERFDTIMLDPPRKGVDPALIDAIIKSNTARIVYVSCNPATLARDASLLAAGGYTVTKAKSVDMFPGTGHVECVCLFTKETINS